MLETRRTDASAEKGKFITDRKGKREGKGEEEWKNLCPLAGWDGGRYWDGVEDQKIK